MRCKIPYFVFAGLAWLGLTAGSGQAGEFGRAQLTWGGYTFGEHVRRIHSDAPGERADAALALGAIAQLRPDESRLAHLAAIEFPDAAQFTSALSGALADNNATVRKNAVSALAFACLIERDVTRRAEWVRTILAKLQDPDASVRCNALDALARLRASYNQRKEQPDLTAALTKAAQDNDAHVRRRLAAVAWHFAPLETLEALRVLLHDSDDLVMLQAVERVGNLGDHAADLKPDLLAVFSKNPHAVLRTLVKLKLLDTDAIPAIGEANQKDPKTLQSVFDALAMLGKPALPALRAMLHKPTTRIQALTALKTMDAVDAQDALEEIRALTRDPDSRVRATAKRAVYALMLDPQELEAILQSGVRLDITNALSDFKRRRSVPPDFLPVLTAHFRGVDKTQAHLCREVLSVISRCAPEGGAALAELAKEFEGDIAVFREHFIEAGPHCAAALPLAIKHNMWEAVTNMTPIDQLPAMLARIPRNGGGNVSGLLRKGLVISPEQASAMRRQYYTLPKNDTCVDNLAELIVRFVPIQELVEIVAQNDQTMLNSYAWSELQYRSVEALPYFDRLFELCTKHQISNPSLWRELQKAASDPAYKAPLHDGQWQRSAFGDRDPRDAEKLFAQAVEDFERDPLDEDCANELLRLYRRDNSDKMRTTTDFPLAILRAARMCCGVASQNGNFEGDWYHAMSWAWKASRPAGGAGVGVNPELADDIDDWLQTRRCSDQSTSTRAGAALFRQCANGVQPDEKALADLFAFYVEGRTWLDRHIAAAQILEAAGFQENARREYARAAGHWAYIQRDVYSLEMDPGRTPRKVSLEEQRQKGWQGYIRMSIALQRWDDAAQALSMIDAGSRAAFAKQIQARQVPTPVADQGPWLREAWRWVPEQVSQDWQLTRLIKIGNDVLCCTPWDATLLNGASGRPSWNWKPKYGGLSYLGNWNGRVFFLIDLIQQRPEDREKGVDIGGRNTARNYNVVPVDLKTGRTGREMNLATVEIKGQQCHALPGGGVLTKTGKAWEISFPLEPEKPPVAVASNGNFAGAGSDVLLFAQGDRLEVCQITTGKALWQEAPDGPSLPQSIQNQLRERPFGLRSGETVCGQVGTMVYHSFAGAVEVHDSTSGKLLWAYSDSVFHVKGMRRVMWPRMTGPFTTGVAGVGASVVCLVFPDNGIVGLDAQNGRFLWRVLRPNDGNDVDIAGAVQFAAPVTAGAPALWFAAQRGLLALYPLSGRTLWSTLLSPEYNAPFAAFLPPLEINGTIIIAVRNNQHLAGFLLAVRTEQRPANAAEAEVEGFSRADLLRAFDGNAAQGGAMQVSALGLAHDPQFRENFKAYALQHGGMDWTRYTILLLAAPFEQEEFDTSVFPKLNPAIIGRVGSFFSALYDVATPEQRVQLDKIAQPPEPFNDNVTPEDARKMAEKMRDGIAAPPPQNAPVKPPRPPDEF